MARTRRKKRRTHVREAEQKQGSKAPPKTFVMKRGKLGSMVTELVQDLRQVMEPYTARNLRESKRNTLKDFVNIAGPLGVTHMLMLSATERSRWLRVAKTPRGPTLTFNIRSFATKTDVCSAQNRPRDPPNAYATPPLVILSGFGQEQHEQLTKTIFQNMFPTLDASSAKLSSCQRAVLVEQEKEEQVIRFRHYTISSVPAGTSRKLRKLVTKREVPDLGHLQDASDWLRPGDVSEAESDDGTSQVSGAGGRGASKSRVRLHEVGPRLDLELVKVEEGLASGLVLYHRHKQRTREEAAQQEMEHRERARQKAKRRSRQASDVRRKRRRVEGLPADDDAAE